MKKFPLLVAALMIAFCAVSLAALPVQPTKGGLKKGTIITLKVVDKVDSQGRLPKWMPKLRKGQKVKFRVVGKGDLMMVSPKFRFKFIAGSNVANTYQGQNLSKGNTLREASAVLRKKTRYAGAAMALTFQETKLNSDFSTTYHGTAYQLE